MRFLVIYKYTYNKRVVKVGRRRKYVINKLKISNEMKISGKTTDFCL